MLNIPTTVSEKNKEEWLAADYLIRRVIDGASGASISECAYNYPRDVYFIGNLRPRNENEVSLSRADLMQKLSPSAFGAEFKLRPKDSKIAILVELKWDCFYRVFPTYKQQKDWINQLNNAQNDGAANGSSTASDNEEEASDETSTMNATDRRQDRRQREDLFVRFKKLKCEAIGTLILTNDGSGNWNTSTESLENNIATAIANALAEINQDAERLRLRIPGQLFTLPPEALQTAEGYGVFLGGLVTEPNNRWSWEIIPNIYSAENDSNEIILFLQFVNSTHCEEGDKTVEPYIFNSHSKIKFEDDIVIPFELELAPKSFRYNRNLWGRGFNCGLEADGNIYITTHTPIFTQFRYKTSDQPEAKFEALSTDPIPVLNNILRLMRDYLNEWDIQDNIYRTQYGNLWDHNYREEYLNDKSRFEHEIFRFEQGIGLIENDPDIKLAFVLSNESFRRAGLDRTGNAQKDRWRLFQIVFMVSQIPGIAGLSPVYKNQFENEREFVDIIYFPTGGGKTEAYLAVLIFHCFYDRLRGKTAGVTCWIRFPLRLLTLQQTQRLADIIGIAEIVRNEQKDVRLNGRGINKFAVGYFVGKEATPNEIIPPQNGRPDPTWSMALDENERQRWKKVVSCPSCKTNSVAVDFDEETVRVIHRCANKHCEFKSGEIPVYVIDNEIYRYLPSVMVGTIDKLAGIGNTRKLSIVFGKVDGYCQTHGYYNSICCQKGCTDKTKLKSIPPKGISGPTLFLQDELHLLKEGLGTFDSHYETFVQYLLRDAGANAPLKIIASSATIEQYERQVEHLYGKQRSFARVFPGMGPTLHKSFYAQTENYPQRIFVGILPHNKTIFNAVLEIIEYYHRANQTLVRESATSNPFHGRIVPGSNDWNKLLDLYYSTLTYFLASRDLDSIKTDIESHINNEIFTNEGLNPIAIKELTGDTSTDEVTAILETLERYHEPSHQHDAVLATNMVSHGVDINRFNCMIFYGIPRQNAEYIQASSRVGRAHVGIVFNCFHPIRERDQSHYSYFTKYHEFLGQMVEPVAINRWSAYSIDKTLPGLFMATVLQILSNRENGGNRNSFYMLNKISQMYQSNEIDREEIKTILKDAFRAGIPNDQRNIEMERKIDRAVNLYFDAISNPGSNESFLSSVLHPRPMKSLRDIDDPITIELDRLGEQWGTN
ncbi:MAG: helicase-related protein [Chitinophagaceae bacterium]